MFTKTAIEQYFIAFKNEQLFLMILGAMALVIAVVFYAGLKTNWHKGFALPLAVFALLNIGAGFSNYKTADVLKVRNAYNYDLHPELLKTKEIPRVQETQQNLKLLIYVNISIILGAAFIFFYFNKKEESQYYMGAAASLFLVAVLGVVLYAYMQISSLNYLKGLREYTANIIVK